MGIREWLYNLFFGRSKPSPAPAPRPKTATKAPRSAKPAVTPSTAKLPGNSAAPKPPQSGQAPNSTMTLAIYHDQIKAFFKCLADSPGTVWTFNFIGLGNYLRARNLNFEDSEAIDAYLKKISFGELYKLMELIGYEVRHVLPVETFDLSWAFREHFERYQKPDRLAFNAEPIPGQDADRQMLNSLQLLNVQEFAGGISTGVNDVHPLYNLVIARFLDQRYIQLRSEMKFQSYAAGLTKSPDTLDPATTQRFQSDLINITRSIKHKLITDAVKGVDGRFVLVNDLFGSAEELQKDKAFLQEMNQLLGIQS